MHKYEKHSQIVSFPSSMRSILTYLMDEGGAHGKAFLGAITLRLMGCSVSREKQLEIFCKKRLRGADCAFVL